MMAKVLIIEDEEMLRVDLAEWLTFENYEVFQAEDGIAGIEHAFRNPPDLILCDIMMPRLDGYGVLLEINANPITAGIPFVFMTALASSDDIRRGMALGADDYVTKPFTRLNLLQAIRARLEKKALLLENQQYDMKQLESKLEHEHEQRIYKAKMVAMFSHDFRNPLAGILSSVGLLKNYADRMDEKRRLIHLNRAEAAVRQLVQMLDDMLFLSQSDTDSLSVEYEELPIGDFLQKMIDEFQAIHNDTHNLHLMNYLSDSVMADSRLIYQITSNLISNAIKYSPSGSYVNITVDKDADHYTLKFEDQGIGIPETDQSRLFAIFQRSSNVGDVRGTGLGLAIVKQAVDLLEGSIQLESQEGIGTTITVRIPLVNQLE